MVQFNDIITLITGLLPSNSQITAANHRTVETAILTFAKEQWLPGDIKMVGCTNAYITANFVTSGPTAGLGLPGGEREGWAICNGLNLTKNLKGRFPLGFTDSTFDIDNDAGNYPTMGATGGFTNAAIIDHTHEYQDAYFAENNGHKPVSNIGGSGDTDGDNGFYYRTRSGVGSVSPPAPGSRPLTDNPQFSTGSGLNKNMPPYIVTLFIQKL